MEVKRTTMNLLGEGKGVQGGGTLGIQEHPSPGCRLFSEGQKPAVGLEKGGDGEKKIQQKGCPKWMWTIVAIARGKNYQ